MQKRRPARQIIVKLSNERLITPSGLAIVGGIIGRSDLAKRVDKLAVLSGKRSPKLIKTSDCFLTYIGMLCQGKPQFEAVKELLVDPEYYIDALGIKTDIPSAETLRQRMDAVGALKKYKPDILKANVSMFKQCKIKPSAMKNGYVPGDLDVSPFDNSKTQKEGVSRTYKGTDGYAPMFGYIGTEGYLADLELRPGKQHSQKGTPEFLKEYLGQCHKLTDEKLLIRMDSGNDAAVNLGILIEDGSWFIIKRNMRSAETKEDWLALVKDFCIDIHKPRDGKTVYVGSSWKQVTYIGSDGKEHQHTIRIVYEVIERTTDKYGQFLMTPDIEVNTWWVNVDFSDDEVIESYHQHGEMEQYHSEIKTDMDIERLPSGKFDTNELVLELTILAYNILRIIGQQSLDNRLSPKSKRNINRRRLRTVISNLILIAGHVTEHAHRTILALGQSNLWRFVFMDLYEQFATS